METDSPTPSLEIRYTQIQEVLQKRGSGASWRNELQDMNETRDWGDKGAYHR